MLLIWKVFSDQRIYSMNLGLHGSLGDVGPTSVYWFEFLPTSGQQSLQSKKVQKCNLNINTCTICAIGNSNSIPLDVSLQKSGAI